MDIKLESEDANFAFPEVAPGTSPDNKSLTARTTVNGISLSGIPGSRTGNGIGNSVSRVVGVTRPRPAMGVLAKRTSTSHQGPVTLSSQLCMSSDKYKNRNSECKTRLFLETQIAILELEVSEESTKLRICSGTIVYFQKSLTQNANMSIL